MDIFAIAASIISGVTLLIVGWVSRKLSKFIHEFQTEHKALIESQKDEIKGQIIAIHARASERGYITHTELEYVNDKYIHYQNLHGNTYVGSLVDQCDRMEVRGTPIPVH